ncbi:hypothetical protein HYC85_000266 [Camellia sinensis]|uniref:Uncharacterized protein n=1 Tax=Camellia sinensis TaxID=4442 RepID=A0A7J7I351_CAMSI|nr:hypothetical protein HYC85_000266 [Camellia sinensis]
MFRMLPTYKCRHFLQYFLSLGTHHQSYFSTASCAQILSHGTEEGSKEIDFEFLFQSCTKIHLAKCLHALLIVSGKAQSIFISTRVVNLYANLGDVTHSRCTFDQIPKEDMPIPGIQCYPPMFAISASMKLSIVYTKCY